MNLASFYVEIGKLSDAMKYLLKAREQSTMPSHLAEICIAQLNIALELQDFKQVLNHVNRAEAMVEMENVEMFTAEVNIFKAIGALSENRYKDVSHCLLTLNGEGPLVQSLLSGGGSFLSIADIGMMAILTAMSSYSVSEFKTSVVNKKSFKPILLAHSKANELALSFSNKEFANLLRLLESCADDLLHDPYLSTHMDHLVTKITEKSVLEYLAPYESVSLQRMSDAFGADVEGVLASLIGKGALAARIDGITGTLFKLKESPKQSSINKILYLGKNHSRDVRRGILRLSLLEHSFCVSSKEKHGLSVFRTPASLEAETEEIDEGREYDDDSVDVI